MKKILPILILGSLIISGYCLSIQATNNNDNYGKIININDEKDGYEGNNYNQYYVSSEELLAMYPVMNEPIIIKDLKNIDIDYSLLEISNIDLPDYFNWKDYQGQDWTTPAKSQGSCGSCWAFAAMGSLESVINIREENPDLDPDLSEQYILSCLPEAGSCNGGNPEKTAFYFIMNTSASGNYCNGIIPESCFIYEADDDIPCFNKCPNWNETLVPISNFEELYHTMTDSSLNDVLKSLIYEHGPIYALFTVTDRFRRWGTYYHKSKDYYPDFIERVPMVLNHAITIVGWKDDPSIGNGGYWICKNTWGNNWGYEGFFNIEYDCLHMGWYVVAWVDYDPVSFDWPPVADAGGFYEINVGQEIIFDGSNSYDSEDDIVYYHWDFGDGSTANDVSPSHIYSEDGIYEVELTVKDKGNKTSKDTTLVGINEPLINLELSGGNGITIEIWNPSSYNLYNKLLSIEVTGSYINMDYRNKIIDFIPAQNGYSLILPLLGFGCGTIDVSLENLVITKQFFIIGPFVLIL